MAYALSVSDVRVHDKLSVIGTRTSLLNVHLVIIYGSSMLVSSAVSIGCWLCQMLSLIESHFHTAYGRQNCFYFFLLFWTPTFIIILCCCSARHLGADCHTMRQLQRTSQNSVFYIICVLYLIADRIWFVTCYFLVDIAMKVQLAEKYKSNRIHCAYAVHCEGVICMWHGIVFHSFWRRLTKKNIYIKHRHLSFMYNR